MTIWELVFIALGLSADAFAVSLCKGLQLRHPRLKHYLTVGAWFGGFQALMPTIGFLLGAAFAQLIDRFDHWIAFALLVLIGANMIREAFSKKEKSDDASLSLRVMLPAAVATSIDALAVGVSFAVLPGVNIIWAVLIIGVTTFALSALGLRLGSVFGVRFRRKAVIAGGVILILIGTKILLEHLSVMPF